MGDSNRRIPAATRIQSWFRGEKVRSSGVLAYKSKQANTRTQESALVGRLEALEAESDALRDEFRVLCDVVDERLTTECDALRVKCEQHSKALANWSRAVSDKLVQPDDGLQGECRLSQHSGVKKKKKLKAQVGRGTS